MKKLLSLLLVLATLMTLLASCFKPDDTIIRVGYMAGPTGMGMAKLVCDNNTEKYEFTKYADTATAKADLTAGNIDVICLPTNEAAAYYNTVDNNLRMLAINCLNSLFLITDKNTTVHSLDDLAGQTVYTCKNGTPRQVLEYIVNALDLDITVSYTADGKDMVTPNDVQAMVIAGKIPNAVIPEPLITAAMLQIQKNGNADIQYSVDIDLNDEWEKISDTPVAMGCIVTTQKFIDEHKGVLDAFLDEYKASVDFIGNMENIEASKTYIVDAGIMAAAPAAQRALTNLNGAIVYSENTKEILDAFYGALGIKKPDDKFYYKK